MEYFLVTLFNLLVMIALAVFGTLLKKTKLVSDRAVKDFSHVLIYIGTPFLIFSTMLKTDIYAVSWVGIVACVVLSVVIHLLGIGLSYLFSVGDKNKARRSACAFSAAFSNCGFLGIPLTFVVVPEMYRMEALLYVTLFNIIFNFMIWIIGAIIFTEKARRNNKLMIKAVLNPCTFGFLLALPFTLTGLNLLEVEYVGSFINYLSGICVPISMFVLGMRIANIKFKESVKSVYVYKTSFIRLIAVPMITLGIALLLRHMLSDIDNAFIIGMTMISAMPTAASAIAFTERFDADSMLASESVTFSTLLSIITLPLIMLLLSML